MPIQAEYVKKYAQWKWDAWVIRNEWLTSAIIPQAGGRILQYNLGEHPLLSGHPGKVDPVKPLEQNEMFNAFCGHQVTPVSNSSPPWQEMPVICSANYTCEMEAEEERIVFNLKSMREDSVSDIEMEKRIAYFSNNTRCEIDFKLINHAKGTKELAFRSLFPYPIVSIGGKDRFQITFPIHRRSRFGAAGVQTDADISAWQGEIAPSVYGVNFQASKGRLISDSREGWVSYWDKKTGLCMTRQFDVFAGRTYPDDGASIAISLNNDPEGLFSEIFGPVRSIQPDGGILSFSESWGASAISEPVIGVNPLGVIARHLAVESGRITGGYGVFYKGSAHLVYRDLRGVMLKRSMPRFISPMQPFNLNEPDGLTSDVRLVELQMNSEEGIEIGVLDSLEVTTG